MIVKRVAGAIGAELRSINLGDGIDAEVSRSLRALLNEHEVLFLRDQSITPSDQKSLAAVFGPLQTHPAYRTVEDLPEVKATAEGAVRLRNGNPGMVIAHDVEYGDEVWASYEGRAVAVGRFKAGELHPSRVFNHPQDA